MESMLKESMHIDEKTATVAIIETCLATTTKTDYFILAKLTEMAYELNFSSKLQGVPLTGASNLIYYHLMPF